MAKKEKLSLEELLEQALVKDEDRPYEVPGNWVWTRFKFLADRLQYGYTESASYDEVGPRFLRITDIQDNNIDWINVPYCPITEKDFEKYKVNNGDIVVARTGATTGKSYLVNNPPIAVFASYLIRISIVSNVVPSYIWLFMNSSYYWNQITENKKGSAQPGVNAQKLGELIIPLPPLPEQQRIVNVIESLFEKLDRAKELAQNALNSFENRKSAMLHKAFTGELTRKWREKNGVEFGDDIVAELYNYRIGLAKTSAERDKVDTTIFKYQEHQNSEKLPESWRYVALEKLCESFQYGTSKKSDNQGEVVVLRMGNLQSGKIDWSNLAYTSDEEDIMKYSLRNGDVLFNRTNSPELVGKTSIYEGEQPAIFAGYLIRIKNLKYLDSYYLNYAMNTSFAKDYCMNVKSDGVNQSNINAQKLAKFEIPFCSIKEQKEIVRILDNLLENEQKAKELCDVIAKIDYMKKAILARAFRGELSTNNPDEESALELLKEMLKKKV